MVLLNLLIRLGSLAQDNPHDIQTILNRQLQTSDAGSWIRAMRQALIASLGIQPSITLRPVSSSCGTDVRSSCNSDTLFPIARSSPTCHRRGRLPTPAATAARGR